MDADDHIVVGWELSHLAELDELAPGEIVCELEEAWRVTGWARGRLGALVVTDLRVLFLHTSKLRRRTHVDSYPLTSIEAAEVLDGLWGVERGALALTVATDGVTSRIEFERMPGGRSRAEEIVGSIERQRAYLQ